MRTRVAPGSAWLSYSDIAERWGRQDAHQRADLIYQAATLAVAALLVATAI